MDGLPKSGERVFCCRHATGLDAAARIHWYALPAPVEMARPDGSAVAASWVAICEGCFVVINKVHGGDPLAVVAGDGCFHHLEEPVGLPN